MTILGTRVDAITNKEATNKIGLFLDGEASRFVVTPNPEIILYAYRHPEYQDILNSSDLSLPDGVGLLFAAKISGQPLAERVSGADLLPEICRLAREKNKTIALVGGLNQTTVEKAAAVMRAWGNKVVAANYGVPKDQWENQAAHDKIISELVAARPDVVFAAFGHPKQEKWIAKFGASLPSVKIFIGCGGALDFIAGVARRAPAWMRKIGLEWLWRLIMEPKRYRRIINAVIVFPLTVIFFNRRKRIRH